MAHYINITVDTEAHPARAERDPLDRLIWGRFGNEEWGIGRMMALADRYGYKLSFYLDYCEYGLYGEGLLDVAREIVRRGHDVQLHVHTDLLSPDFPAGKGLRSLPAMNFLDGRAAMLVAEHVTELAVRATGQSPLGFRGGAFRFNSAVIEAFASIGCKLSANYHSGAKYWIKRKPHAKLFRWPNGMIELPLSTAHVDNLYRYSIFENFPVESCAAFSRFATAFENLPGPIGVHCHLLHSWSLLSKNEQGQFDRPDESRLSRLDAFFKNLQDLTIKVVTTDRVIDLTRSVNLPTLKYETVFRPHSDGDPDYGIVAASLEERARERGELMTIIEAENNLFL